MKNSHLRKKIVLSLLIMFFWVTVGYAETTIKIWSHWANQPSKRKPIELVMQDYMKDHPDVKIEITWWDKNPMVRAFTALLAGGSGEIPNIVSDAQPQWIQSGVMARLDDTIDYNRFLSGAKTWASYPTYGKPDAYQFPIETSFEIILYNKEIFKEVGIEVGPDHQLDEDEFIDALKKIRAAGYDGFANAIGNRPYTARYITEFATLNLVGHDDYQGYFSGLKSWDTPDMKRVLKFTEDVTNAKAWPKNFGTMTIDEFHVYFHTQRKAAMLMIGSWYSSRAFNSVEKGGQDPNWRFGMMKYPRMKNGKGNDYMLGSFGTGWAVTVGKKQAIAKDILKYWSERPKYGAIFSHIANVRSAINYKKEDLPSEYAEMPNKYAWYLEEINRIYGDLKVAVKAKEWSGGFKESLKTSVNEGLPSGMLTPEEVIARINKTVKK